jgi:hypothetical protein
MSDPFEDYAVLRKIISDRVREMFDKRQNELEGKAIAGDRDAIRLRKSIRVWDSRAEAWAREITRKAESEMKMLIAQAAAELLEEYNKAAEKKRDE